MIELIRIRVSQRVLILRLLESAADRDVLRGLHEEVGADHLGGDLRPQLLDDLLNANALRQRLELNEHAGGILARIAAGGAPRIRPGRKPPDSAG